MGATVAIEMDMLQGHDRIRVNVIPGDETTVPTAEVIFLNADGTERHVHKMDVQEGLHVVRYRQREDKTQQPFLEPMDMVTGDFKFGLTNRRTLEPLLSEYGIPYTVIP